MQITKIECELGVYYGTGDYQGVRSTVKAAADVGYGEDAQEAYKQLSSFVHAQVLNGAHASHPDRVKEALAGMGDAPALAAPKTAEAAKKSPGRPKKDAAPASAPATEKLADTTGMDIGGLDKEDELDASDDDLDALLGDGPAETPVTREELQAALVATNKACGKPAVLEIMKKVGAASLSQIPEAKYGEVKKACDAAIAKHGAAAK